MKKSPIPTPPAACKSAVSGFFSILREKNKVERMKEGYGFD
jgi:hypothetical protein